MIRFSLCTLEKLKVCLLKIPPYLRKNCKGQDHLEQQNYNGWGKERIKKYKGQDDGTPSSGKMRQQIQGFGGLHALDKNPVNHPICCHIRLFNILLIPTVSAENPIVTLGKIRPESDTFSRVTKEYSDF